MTARPSASSNPCGTTICRGGASHRPALHGGYARALPRGRAGGVRADDGCRRDRHRREARCGLIAAGGPRRRRRSQRAFSARPDTPMLGRHAGLHDPRHVYGLLTHPSVPPLTAALVMAQRLGGVDGRRSCWRPDRLRGREQDFRMDDGPALSPGPPLQRTGRDLRRRGGHGEAAGPLGERLAHALGIAASFAAGIGATSGR